MLIACVTLFLHRDRYVGSFNCLQVHWLAEDNGTAHAQITVRFALIYINLLINKSVLIVF